MSDEETESTCISGVEVDTKYQVRVAELLGKRFALWTDNQDINGNINPVQILDNILKDSDRGG